MSIKRFRVTLNASDRDLLAALLRGDQYHDHYAGQPVTKQTHHSLHGPYKLSAISPSEFVAVSVGEAERATSIGRTGLSRCLRRLGRG